MKLLLHPPVDRLRLERIQAVDPQIQTVNAESETEAHREIAEADAMFGKLTPNLLARAKQLRWVQAPTASMESFLFPELTAHPCVVTGMRGLYSDIIADHVLGYLLCFARNFHRYIRQQSMACWEPVGGEQQRQGAAVAGGVQSALDLGHVQLAGQTLGIVGLGHIGREIAQRALAFRMRVVAIDPQCDNVPPNIDAVWPPEELDRLLRESDFVVIAAPHTPKTVKLFRRPQLQAMKRSAYLINIGRGAVVDLNDLCEALATGEIAGAGLDVFEIEPLPSAHPLWKFENVIITPHVAGCAPEVSERHLRVLLTNLQRFVRGESLENVVNKELWY
ncbi:MAG: D-2-hydroxyacid dehydrogenase [Planctomycetota bacterium]|nr:D-2-hydroxyacid dehydrogenase [Planctomycetota bacterium]